MEENNKIEINDTENIPVEITDNRRDDLYYATVDRATVRIEADWTPARQIGRASCRERV